MTCFSSRGFGGYRKRECQNAMHRKKDRGGANDGWKIWTATHDAEVGGSEFWGTTEVPTIGSL